MSKQMITLEIIFYKVDPYSLNSLFKKYKKQQLYIKFLFIFLRLVTAKVNYWHDTTSKKKKKTIIIYYL